MRKEVGLLDEKVRCLSSLPPGWPSGSLPTYLHSSLGGFTVKRLSLWRYLDLAEHLDVAEPVFRPPQRPNSLQEECQFSVGVLAPRSLKNVIDLRRHATLRFVRHLCGRSRVLRAHYVSLATQMLVRILGATLLLPGKS